MPVSPGLLLLADSRLPAGGHAHSGGLEAAAAAGSVTGLDGLADFLRGRLATAGLVSAGLGAPGRPGGDRLGPGCGARAGSGLNAGRMTASMAADRTAASGTGASRTAASGTAASRRAASGTAANRTGLAARAAVAAQAGPDGGTRITVLRSDGPLALWVDFSNVPAASNLTFASFPKNYSRLPTVAFVIPNLCHDTEYCSRDSGAAGYGTTSPDMRSGRAATTACSSSSGTRMAPFSGWVATITRSRSSSTGRMYVREPTASTPPTTASSARSRTCTGWATPEPARARHRSPTCGGNGYTSAMLNGQVTTTPGDPRRDAA